MIKLFFINCPLTIDLKQYPIGHLFEDQWTTIYAQITNELQN